jgi:hypothetical protein
MNMMIFPAGKNVKYLFIYSATLFFVFQASPSFSSPAACDRNSVSKFISSDLVVLAKVVKSRRWKAGMITLHLVAKYQILEVYKGDAKKDSIQIATTTCLEKSRPKNDMLGYPTATPYCPGGFNIHLTGVDSKTGQPKEKGENTSSWIIFLKKDSWKGARQLTWIEVPTTSFSGECHRDEKEIPQEQQEGFRRMMEHEKRL